MQRYDAEAIARNGAPCDRPDAGRLRVRLPGAGAADAGVGAGPKKVPQRVVIPVDRPCRLGFAPGKVLDLPRWTEVEVRDARVGDAVGDALLDPGMEDLHPFPIQGLFLIPQKV
ncbi:hypothetical protein HC776_03520 [bacterium]|nr:hypothetical protein [bacterium]